MSRSLVAVYGTLRRGQGNHCILSRTTAPLLVTERTQEHFNMFTNWSHGGGYPFIVPVKTSNSSKNVVIEVYEVDEYTLERLDQLEGYPHHYDRKLTPTSVGEAWIYFQSKAMLKARGDTRKSVRIFHGDWIDWQMGFRGE